MPHRIGPLLDGTSLRNFKPEHYTILVVDDALSHRLAVRKILESEGYKVFDVDSGQACLEFLEARIPHLILLDMNMPGMDGEQTCMSIRENVDFQSVPVVFLSSESDAKVKIKALDAGANDFILKNSNHDEMLARVRNQIQVASLFSSLEQSRSNSQSLLHVLHHDLNNYLSSINGYFTLLRLNLEHQDLPTNVQDSLDDMAECLKFTNIYLREIGELQSVVEGTVPVDLHCLKLKSVFEEVQKVFHDRLKIKSLELDLSKIDPKCTVLADPRWFGLSVINNLISNAIKFSYPNSTIAVESFMQGKKTTILIKDQGIGIPNQLLRMINSGNKSFTRKGTMGEKGTGFGLKLVRHWVELFNGSIEIESLCEEDGGQLHGTRVELILPCCG